MKYILPFILLISVAVIYFFQHSLLLSNVLPAASYLLIAAVVVDVLKNIMPTKTKTKFDFFPTDVVARSLLLVFTLILFFSTLFEKWYGTGIATWQLGGGIIPVGDSFAYFSGIQEYWYDKYLSGISSWKPLMTLYYASIFRLFGNSMLDMQVITTALFALSGVLLGLRLYKYWGLSPALLYSYSAALFIHEFTGSIMAEPLGFSVSQIAIIFLLDAIYQKKFSRFLWGVACFSVAMNIRMGAMFVFPLLFLYGVWFLFKQTNFKKTLGILGLVLALGFGFLLSSTINKTTNTPKEQGNTQQGSFYYLFYTFLKGKNLQAWRDIHKDYPELTSLPSSERYRMIRQISLDTFTQNPQNFFSLYTKSTGRSLKNLPKLLFPSTGNLYYYFSWLNLLLIFVGIGASIFLYLKKRSKPEMFILILLLLVIIGVVLSNFIQINYRSLSATYPFHYLLLALCLYQVLYLIKVLLNPSDEIKIYAPKTYTNFWNYAWMGSYFILLLLSIFLPATKALSLGEIENASCTCKGKGAVIQLGNGNFINFSGEISKLRNTTNDKYSLSQRTRKMLKDNAPKAIFVGKNLLNTHENTTIFYFDTFLDFSQG
ncbi:MAG: hypothetical protein R2798_03760 [Chitinophagales bacterium]|nr:hypothetical protein [Bacteroidota bacterium]MCB9043098.1 hypothetical protein [Chitinophagales bacterium]